MTHSDQTLPIGLDVDPQHQSVFVAETVQEYAAIAQKYLNEAHDLLKQNEQDPRLSNLRTAVHLAQLDVVLVSRTCRDVGLVTCDDTQPLLPVGQS